MSRKKTVTTVNNSFASNILALIKSECAGNLKAFGASISVSYDTVLSWTKGEFLPGGAQLISIKKQYGVSLDWLMAGKEGGLSFGNWSEEAKEYCEKMKNIFDIGDKTSTALLKTNIDAIGKSIDLVKYMKEDLDMVKEEIRHLKAIRIPETSTGADSGVLLSTGNKETLYTSVSENQSPATIQEQDPVWKKAANKK